VRIILISLELRFIVASYICVIVEYREQCPNPIYNYFLIGEL
jgi:hypothetical protein